MKINKKVMATLVSIVFTAFILAIFSYFIDDELFSGGGSWIGPPKEPWLFKVIFVAIYGAIIGAVTGIIISSFNFNLIAGTILGLFFNLLIGAILGSLVINPGLHWSIGMTKVYYATIIVGIINGAIVSLINSSEQTLK